VAGAPPQAEILFGHSAAGDAAGAGKAAGSSLAGADPLADATSADNPGMGLPQGAAGRASLAAAASAVERGALAAHGGHSPEYEEVQSPGPGTTEFGARAVDAEAQHPAEKSQRARGAERRAITENQPQGAGSMPAVPVSRETGRARAAGGPALYAGAASPTVRRPERTQLAGTVSRETQLGAGAARLISGTAPEHLALEEALAEWLGTESALLFSSAYAANLGAVSALGAPGDVIFSDALNHASIIDGCRLSRAQSVVVPHRDLPALERALSTIPPAPGGARWVITESYFGMDGTSPDFSALRALCDRWQAALIVDEAHSVGTFGPEGRGLCAGAGVRPDVLTGGFGKAFGLQGGFVACSGTVRSWLWNRARSFVFSTATSPWLCARTLESLRWIRGSDALRRRLRRHALRLEARLRAEGIEFPPGHHGPVFPIVFGSESSTLEAARSLRAMGVLAHPVRPPTVPPGTARIRVTLRADLSDDDVELLANALVQVWRFRQSSSSPVRSAGASRHSPGPVSVAATAARAAAEPSREQKRWVVLGTGTGIGKSFVAEALVRALSAREQAVAGLKPVETGCRTNADGSPAEGDAARLEAASSSVRHPRPHPLYALAEPLAPSLAARREGQTIALEVIASWVDRVRPLSAATPHHLVIETAGGVFSPLGDGLANYDLARCLGETTWLLVAPDRLGVLHDVASTVRAMGALGRLPECILLNPLPPADSSTGSNAAELRRMGLGVPVIELSNDSIQELLFGQVGAATAR
jgi:8-amino-7-oxononanoate synthase